MKYNSIVIGDHNYLSGQDNVVIGSRNNLKGSNYWVFDSDVSAKGVKDGVLIIENYLIELTDLEMLLKNPYKVIKCINSAESNGRWKAWWNKSKPTLKICV